MLYICVYYVTKKIGLFFGFFLQILAKKEKKKMIETNVEKERNVKIETNIVLQLVKNKFYT